MSPVTRTSISLLVLLVTGLFLVSPLFAQQFAVSPPLDVNPFVNLLALALVIERLLEIGVTFFPGLEEKKAGLKETELAKLQVAIQKATMAIGMGLGVVACVFFQFGVLDEIFPGKISPANWFNAIITGVIAGAGADPVHQMVLILASVRERLSSTRSR